MIFTKVNMPEHAYMLPRWHINIAALLSVHVILMKCCILKNVSCSSVWNWSHFTTESARRGGAEVAGWTRVWALWWQGGKRRLRTSRCPCRGRLGTLKTPSCPWRGCPAAGQNLETGHLSRHYIAEIPLNVTLNHKQTNKQTQLKVVHFVQGRQQNYYQTIQTK